MEKSHIETKKATERFYHDIVHWYRVSQYPQELIDAIMQNHQPNTLGPYLQATPETVARVFVREYADANRLTYAGIEKQLAHITNQRKGAIR